MKVTLKQIKATLELERTLLSNAAKHKWDCDEIFEAAELCVKHDFVNWLLEDVFTGHIYMTPSQLEKRRKRNGK